MPYGNFFLALELFVGFIFLMWTSYFTFGGKALFCVFEKQGKTWLCNVKLHIKYLEFLQERLMTYSLLSKHVTNVNEVQ